MSLVMIKGLEADVSMRRPRPFFAPVTLSHSTDCLAGFADRLGGDWIRVQSLDDMPLSGVEYALTLDIGETEVLARGVVRRVFDRTHRYTVELTHLDRNGDTLLSALIA